MLTKKPALSASPLFAIAIMFAVAGCAADMSFKEENASAVFVSTKSVDVISACIQEKWSLHPATTVQNDPFESGRRIHVSVDEVHDIVTSTIRPNLPGKSKVLLFGVYMQLQYYKPELQSCL